MVAVASKVQCANITFENGLKGRSGVSPLISAPDVGGRMQVDFFAISLDEQKHLVIE